MKSYSCLLQVKKDKNKGQSIVFTLNSLHVRDSIYLKIKHKVVTSFQIVKMKLMILSCKVPSAIILRYLCICFSPVLNNDALCISSLWNVNSVTCLFIVSILFFLYFQWLAAALRKLMKIPTKNKPVSQGTVTLELTWMKSLTNRSVFSRYFFQKGLIFLCPPMSQTLSFMPCEATLFMLKPWRKNTKLESLYYTSLPSVQHCASTRHLVRLANCYGIHEIP